MKSMLLVGIPCADWPSVITTLMEAHMLEQLFGKKVTLELPNTSATLKGPFASITPLTYTLEGILTRRPKWDKNTDNVSLHIVGDDIPLRVINTRSILKVNGRTLVQPGSRGIRTFEVEGSKGAKYIVTDERGNWSCTCVAGSFNKMCKHVLSVKDSK